MDIEKTYPDKSDFLRYVLWALLAYTTAANRREYRMSTTWLPHLVTNSLSLLLPDAVRLIFPQGWRSRNIVEATLTKMVRDNRNYAVYAAPLALGYILSHPRFNIYKGDWANLELAGFALDSIPHSATAFALSALVGDTLRVMAHEEEFHGGLARLLRWGNHRRALVSLTVLALITFFWEYSEYRVHNYELSQRGDAEHINMQWSAEDTAKDVRSNLLGWALAVLWQGRRG
ncbi:MAG TPA: hypothetical protein VHO69_13415 [Phototrophicaceae bacterium]|nr:hypothetical protein [Phototrophicaceae bacterium]